MKNIKILKNIGKLKQEAHDLTKQTNKGNKDVEDYSNSFAKLMTTNTVYRRLLKNGFGKRRVAVKM